VQSDGALVETGATTGNGFNNAVVKREAADLSPDFVFASVGRVTDYGYEIEVRIPFKSLKFQPQREQSWGINVVRVVRHSGREDSWTPAKPARASFLAQSGKLVGLTGLHRGMVLDFTPSVTSKTIGSPGASGWEYAGGGPELGGTVRWGVTNNLNLNGTANPDFSQVESDVQQFVFDPRNELFFQEKRPFFLDGIEQFSTPNNLIYTRRIVQPVVAAKLTGKAFGTDLAILSAVDDRATSVTGEEHPVYNILRIQRDLGAQSRLGLVYRQNRRQRLQPGSRCRQPTRLRRDLQRAASAGRQRYPAERYYRDGSALVRASGAQRPHLRSPVHHQRHRRRFSGRERVHRAAGHRSRQSRPQSDVLREAGRMAGELYW
jgi:hypothetical protein